MDTIKGLTANSSMALSKPATTGQAFTQLLFKIAGNGSLRGAMTPDKGFQSSILHFIEKTCAYKVGSSSARAEWSRIKATAKDPTAKFHAEAVAIIAGTE